MPNMTLSISDGLMKLMKKYPEVKWSEVARLGIVDYLNRRHEEEK